MQLGVITPGVIRTVRYFRGSSVIQNKQDEICVEVNPKGGITALFEINYDTQIIRAALSVARDNDTDEQGRVLGFNRREGLRICEERFNAGVVTEFDYDKDSSLLENLYGHLTTKKIDNSITCLERTVLQKMEDYANQNISARNLYDTCITMDNIETISDALPE